MSLILSSTTTPSCPSSRTSHSSATPQPATALPVQLASLSKLLQRNPPAPAAPPAQLASLPRLSQRCNEPGAYVRHTNLRRLLKCNPLAPLVQLAIRRNQPA